MSFALRGSPGTSSALPPHAEASVAPGKATLASQLHGASPVAAPAAGKAEATPSVTRAHVGELAEGSHPGVKRGGGGRRRIGHIVGGTFVRDPGGAAAATQPAPATAATGREGARAYVGSPSVADRTISDGSLSISLKNETDEQVEAVATAISMAAMVVDRALDRLADPASPRVAAALTKNFHSTDAAVVRKVSSVLQRIRAAFNGTIPVEIEGSDRNDARAFVPYEVSGDVVIYGDIHLCPPWFADPDPVARLRTIIHECSHKFAGTDDVAYHWEGHYEALTPDDALDNADSYAWFCLEAF